MKRILQISFVFGAAFSFAVSAAYAGVMDPVPILKNIPDDPPENFSSLVQTRDFFCPLSKNFSNDLDKIAVETILLESLGEGYAGMVAVGEVIRNREKLFIKNSENICLMPKQFSCWNDEIRAKEYLNKYRAYYFVAYTAWLASKVSTLTGGATDYHADSMHPYWADAYRVAAHIGKHIFYVR